MTSRARAVLLTLTCGLVLGACGSVTSTTAPHEPIVTAEPGHVALVASTTRHLPSKKSWLRDVSKALKPANAYLDARAKKGGRLAIVLDIDNTSLSTQYDWPRPVTPTLSVARHARSTGYSVFFVTGRYYSDLKNVAGPLKRAGYVYAGICGRNPGESVRHSKQRCRASIANLGYTITASIANNPVDFVGANYERAFALPNYGGLLS